MAQNYPPPSAPGQPPPSQSSGDDAFSSIVPYKNKPALIAYYLGVFSLIPCLGIALGIAGFVLGLLGLKEARLHPESKGKVHAWIGILLGGGMALLNIVVIVVLLAGAA